MDNQINSKKRDYNLLNAQELQWKLKSKADFVTYLDQHREYLCLFMPDPPVVQYYLPPEDVINKDFLKEVLAGEKLLFKKTEVNYIAVPH